MSVLTDSTSTTKIAEMVQYLVLSLVFLTQFVCVELLRAPELPPQGKKLLNIT